jgi:catechol 2,3-dioxygenase-like lactoylglutathione lyase family enzyme
MVLLTPPRRLRVSATVKNLEMKLEVVVIPVADVDRAKEFYGRLGWRLDADVAGAAFRIVQFTPRGSGCSIQFGTNVTTAAPGSAQTLYLIVSDIEAARDELVARGVEVGEVFHEEVGGARFGTQGRVSGPDPEGGTYRSFATFSDPDGNGGCSRRSRTGFPAASTRATRGTPPRAISRARCGVRRRRMASTSSAPARRTRTGPTGTPASWWRSGAGRSSRCEHSEVRPRFPSRVGPASSSRARVCSADGTLGRTRSHRHS